MAEGGDDLTVEAAAELLGLEPRTVQHYGSKGVLVEVRRVGARRVFYTRASVEALAEERAASSAAKAASVTRPKQEMVPAGPLLEYLRSRDQELAEREVALQRAVYELGQTRSELERRQLVEHTLGEVQVERDALRGEIARLRLQRALLVGFAVAAIVAIAAIVVIAVLR